MNLFLLFCPKIVQPTWLLSHEIKVLYVFLWLWSKPFCGKQWKQYRGVVYHSGLATREKS